MELKSFSYLFMARRFGGFGSVVHKENVTNKRFIVHIYGV